MSLVEYAWGWHMGICMGICMRAAVKSWLFTEMGHHQTVIYIALQGFQIWGGWPSENHGPWHLSPVTMINNPSKKFKYLGKFHHDRTLFSRTLKSWFIFGKSSPNGRTIQVSEIVLNLHKFTQKYDSAISNSQVLFQASHAGDPGGWWQIPPRFALGLPTSKNIGNPVFSPRFHHQPKNSYLLTWFLEEIDRDPMTAWLWRSERLLFEPRQSMAFLTQLGSGSMLSRHHGADGARGQCWCVLGQSYMDTLILTSLLVLMGISTNQQRI